MAASDHRRVLVVDDDANFLKVCLTVLRRVGFEVEGVEDANEALKRIEGTRYDCVVSDLQMPDMTGLRLLESARRVDPDVPMVLMTGAPSIESAIDAIDLGVRKYLQKPFDVDVFVNTVTSVASRRTTSGERAVQSPRLDRALEGLWMAFQPIVEFSQKRPLAYEALMRTNAPDVKGPGEMLQLAESTGRIHELGRRVRQQIAGVLDNFMPEADIFVNLHPADLEDSELYDLKSPLTRHARKVVLEITERASVNHDAQLTERIMALRGVGYRIAVDDLGAGYSGLTTLALVQPEFVKIDGALVRNIDSSSVNQLIVTAVCDLSRELNVRVVAECIETHKELATLRALGVDLMQGYLFAKPTPQFVQIDFTKFESQPTGQQP
ncbi:MAG: hypothetical protein DI536_00770 [Archangium gephyra]|uniref:Diguanylate phosphodiesterase n=1 Tax=Archangium gephyra TaxID=48 RepID=A0A2W5U1T6_9BACT|nr:MAG: hypothetical protein DI536_00770 [Archangium gephyra]